MVDSFVEEFMTMMLPEDRRIETFAGYLTGTYISAEYTFPPTVWPELPSETRRITNGAKSYHSHFNEQFYASHSSFLYFLTFYKNNQS